MFLLLILGRNNILKKGGETEIWKASTKPHKEEKSNAEEVKSGKKKKIGVLRKLCLNFWGHIVSSVRIYSTSVKC